MSGYEAVTQAIQWAINKAGLAYTAKFVPAEDESVDDEIEISPTAGGPAPISLQIGPYGASLNRYTYREDGTLVSMQMVKQYDTIVTATVCADIVAALASVG